MNVGTLLGLVLLATCLVAGTLPAADLMAGAAKIDITPKEAVYMAGYDSNRLATPENFKTPLSARALVIKSGDRVVTFVGVDSMGVPGPIQREIREAVKSVPAETVLISATHDHSAPDLYGMWGPEPDKSGVNPRYLAAFKQALVTVIEQAAAALRPAKLKLGSTQTEGINVNHRPVPIVDRELSAMQLVDAEGKVIATLANFPCHAEIMQNNMLSADFPYYFYEKVEKEMGGVAIFVQGALGGMITADIPGGVYKLEGQDNSKWAQLIGEKVADATRKALADAKPIENPELNYKIVDIAVPLENQAYRMAMEAGVMPNLLVDGKVVSKVAALTLGPAQIATVPGELLPNLGFRLKRNMTGSPKFIFGLTFDELGYIVSADDWGLDLYKYESLEASIGPEIGPAVMGALLPMLAEMKPAGSPPPVAARGPLAAQVAAWFNALPGKLNAEKAAGVKSVYHFSLSGEGGGEWSIAIAEGKCTVIPKAPDKADLNVKVSAQDWMDIVTGKLDAMAAFTAGRLEVDDVGRALEMAGLFLSD